VRLSHIVPQPYRGLAVSAALLLTGTMAMSTYIPLYVRAGLEGSPALTAWSVLPLPVGWTRGSIGSRRTGDRRSDSRIRLTGSLAMSTYIPLYVRAGLEGSPALTAWSVLPLTVGWTLGSIGSSRMGDRMSESRIILTAFLIGLPSLSLSWAAITFDFPLFVKYLFFLTSGSGTGMVTNAALTMLRSFAESSQVG